jgi:hypothetical protein
MFVSLIMFSDTSVKYHCRYAVGSFTKLGCVSINIGIINNVYYIHILAYAVLVAFVRGKRSNRECLEDGSQHLKLLDAIKKEFKVSSTHHIP